MRNSEAIGNGGRKRPWRQDERGVSAVEFALVAPFLIVMFMGLSDLTTATLAQLHVNHAAEGTADVVASEQNLTQTNMANMLNTANYFMTPYSSSPLNVRITNIYTDGTSGHNYGIVYWSCAMNGSSTSKYSPYTALSTQFTVVPGTTQPLSNVLWIGNSKSSATSVIVVETTYNFSSPSGFFIKTATMTSSYATIPRVSNYVGFPYVSTTLPAPTATTTAKTVTLTGTATTATCSYAS